MRGRVGKATVSLIAVSAMLLAGCVRQPFIDGRMTAQGVPERHAVVPVMHTPFSKDLYDMLTEYRGAVTGGDTGGGGGGGGGWLDLGSCSGSGEEAIIVLAIYATFIAVVGVVYIVDYTSPEIAYVSYSVPMGAVAAVTNSTRLVLYDTPKNIYHYLRTRRGRIVADIRHLTRIWNGPGKRGNPVFAVRGSGQMIIAYRNRLRRATGVELSVDPEEWIGWYESQYGEWKWERPRNAKKPNPVDF